MKRMEKALLRARVFVRSWVMDIWLQIRRIEWPSIVRLTHRVAQESAAMLMASTLGLSASLVMPSVARTLGSSIVVRTVDGCRAVGWLSFRASVASLARSRHHRISEPTIEVSIMRRRHSRVDWTRGGDSHSGTGVRSSIPTPSMRLLTTRPPWPTASWSPPRPCIARRYLARWAHAMPCEAIPLRARWWLVGEFSAHPRQHR
jgi:hypothetical protein